MSYYLTYIWMKTWYSLKHISYAKNRIEQIDNLVFYLNCWYSQFSAGNVTKIGKTSTTNIDHAKYGVQYLLHQFQCLGIILVCFRIFGIKKISLYTNIPMTSTANPTAWK